MSESNSLAICDFKKKMVYPRAIELGTPLHGYTGEKRKEIIKGPTEDRQKRPIDQFIIGYTGYVKSVEQPKHVVKYSEHKLNGYTGFASKEAAEQKVNTMIKPHTVQPGVHKSQVPGYTGFRPDTRDKIGHSFGIQTRGDKAEN